MEEKIRKKWRGSFLRLFLVNFVSLGFIAFVNAYFLKSTKPLFSAVLPFIILFFLASLVYVFAYEKKGWKVLSIYCVVLLLSLFGFIIIGNHQDWETYLGSLLGFCLTLDFFIKSIRLLKFNRLLKKRRISINQ